MVDNIIVPVSVIGGLALLFGIGLSFASKMFAVKVDKRVGYVRNALPGANCAACGFSGCDAFAEAVVEGKAPVSGCPVGGAKTAAKIAEILGVDSTDEEPKTARVMCQGDYDKSVQKFEYSGIEDCAAAV